MSNAADSSRNPHLPRLGFLGAGWIGRSRLEAISRSGVAEIAAIADPSAAHACEARQSAPRAVVAASLEELLAFGVDGVAIATPSALHAEQAGKCLSRGIPVFCQKPLARTARECCGVIEAARRADRLLSVDFSYRFTEGMAAIYQAIHAGELGEVYAIDMAFHNAYGPDKAWFYDRQLSGGGCVIDLGIHLVDLALWVMDYPRVHSVCSRLYHQGRPLRRIDREVEDYAAAQIDLESGAIVRMACSWRLAAGRDAVIEARFFGTRAGASFHNLDGSFYDFAAELFRGTERTTLSRPPDAWGGRAAVAWADRLTHSNRYDPAAQNALLVAAVIDAIYGA